MPEWVQLRVATTLEFTASVWNGLNRFNEFNDRTTTGKMLNSQIMNGDVILLTFREYYETEDIPADGKARADKIKDIFNNEEMAVVPEMYYFYGIVPDKRG